MHSQTGCANAPYSLSKCLSSLLLHVARQSGDHKTNRLVSINRRISRVLASWHWLRMSKKSNMFRSRPRITRVHNKRNIITENAWSRVTHAIFCKLWISTNNRQRIQRGRGQRHVTVIRNTVRQKAGHILVTRIVNIFTPFHF